MKSQGISFHTKSGHPVHSLTHLIPGVHTIFLIYCMLDRETHIVPVIGYVQKVLIYVITVIRYVRQGNKSYDRNKVCSECSNTLCLS